MIGWRPCAAVVGRQCFEEREGLLTPILHQIGEGRLAGWQGKICVCDYNYACVNVKIENYGKLHVSEHRSTDMVMWQLAWYNSTRAWPICFSTCASVTCTSYSFTINEREHDLMHSRRPISSTTFLQPLASAIETNHFLWGPRYLCRRSLILIFSQPRD